MAVTDYSKSFNQGFNEGSLPKKDDEKKYWQNRPKVTNPSGAGTTPSKSKPKKPKGMSRNERNLRRRQGRD